LRWVYNISMEFNSRNIVIPPPISLPSSNKHISIWCSPCCLHHTKISTWISNDCSCCLIWWIIRSSIIIWSCRSSLVNIIMSTAVG
jgi:hypothetical protein